MSMHFFFFKRFLFSLFFKDISIEQKIPRAATSRDTEPNKVIMFLKKFWICCRFGVCQIRFVLIIIRAENEEKYREHFKIFRGLLKSIWTFRARVWYITQYIPPEWFFLSSFSWWFILHKSLAIFNESGLDCITWSSALGVLWFWTTEMNNDWNFSRKKCKGKKSLRVWAWTTPDIPS